MKWCYSPHKIVKSEGILDRNHIDFDELKNA